MLARNAPSKNIIDAFKMLLNNNLELDLSTFNNDGQTVVDIALDKGNEDLVSLLQAKILDDPNAGFNDFWQAIDEAAASKKVDFSIIKKKFKPHFWNLPGPGRSGTYIFFWK